MLTGYTVCSLIDARVVTLPIFVPAITHARYPTLFYARRTRLFFSSSSSSHPPRSLPASWLAFFFPGSFLSSIRLLSTTDRYYYYCTIIVITTTSIPPVPLPPAANRCCCDLNYRFWSDGGLTHIHPPQKIVLVPEYNVFYILAYLSLCVSRPLSRVDWVRWPFYALEYVVFGVVCGSWVCFSCRWRCWSGV